MEINEFQNVDFLHSSTHYANGCPTKDIVERNTMYLEQNGKPVGELKMEYFCTESQMGNATSSIPDLHPPACNNASVFSTTSSEDYPSTVGFQDNPSDHCDTHHTRMISQQQTAKLSEGLFVRSLIGRCKRIAPLWFRGVSSMRERNREENRRMANNSGQTQSDWRIISMKIMEMNAMSETDAVANLLKKLYKELPVDSVFWFLKCWLGSEDTLADPNSCVISRGDSKGRMRRIDGGKGSDKVWRLDTIVGMLYHGLPMSSTDTNIMVHTCDQELCVRPQHIRFRASSVALVVVLKALAQAGYTLIPPSVPAGSNGVAPSASDESVDVFGPFSIDELQRYRSENLRPIAESYSKLTLSASDQELVKAVPVLRRAIDLEASDEASGCLPWSATSANSDQPTHHVLVNGLKTEPLLGESSSADDGQQNRAISPGRLCSPNNNNKSDITPCDPASNSLVNGGPPSLTPVIHHHHRKSTASPLLSTSLAPSASQPTSQSTLSNPIFSSSSSSATNTTNFHPVLLQPCVVSSAAAGGSLNLFLPAQNQCPASTTVTPTLHRPLAHHHQRYSLKRPAPSSQSPPPPPKSVPVTCPNLTPACLFTASRRNAGEPTSSSPPLLISDVNSFEQHTTTAAAPRFTRMRLSDSDTGTSSAVLRKSQACGFAPATSPGQSLAPPPVLFQLSGHSLSGSTVANLDSGVYLPAAVDTTTTSVSSGLNGSLTVDVHHRHFPGSSGSGKNTPRQPAKKRLEARTPTIEGTIGDDEGSGLLLTCPEEGLAECSSLSLASNGSGNTTCGSGSSAFRVHQNTPFVPVISRLGRPSSTGPGSAATALVSKTTSSGGLATPTVALYQTQPTSAGAGREQLTASIRGEDEESEMDQELVDIMTYRRESLLQQHQQQSQNQADAAVNTAADSLSARDPGQQQQQRAIEVLMASLAGCRYNSPAFECHTPTNQRRSVSACSLPRLGASPNEDLSELTALQCSTAALAAGRLLAVERGKASGGGGVDGHSVVGNSGTAVRRCPHDQPTDGIGLHASSLTPPPKLLSCLGNGGGQHNSNSSRLTDMSVDCGGGALAEDFGSELANIVRQSPASGISQDLIDMLCNMAQQYGMQQSRAGSRASRSSSRVAQSFYRSLINGSTCASPFLPTTVIPLTPSSGPALAPYETAQTSTGHLTMSTAPTLVTPDPMLLALSTPSPVLSTRGFAFTPVSDELSHVGLAKSTACHDLWLARSSCPSASSSTSVVNCHRSSTQ